MEEEEARARMRARKLQHCSMRLLRMLLLPLLRPRLSELDTADASGTALIMHSKQRAVTRAATQTRREVSPGRLRASAGLLVAGLLVFSARCSLP